MELDGINLEKIVLNVHIVSSVVPSILTIIILFRSFRAKIKAMAIQSTDRLLPLYLVVSLYFQLILGVLLYLIHIRKFSVIQTAEQASLFMNRRYWALEHFVLMFFVLAFSHIAYVYAKEIKTPNIFFNKSLIYFVLVLILISYSLIINAVRYA